MAERRPPLPVPKGSPPSPEHMWRQLIRLWEYVSAGHDGMPAPHVHLDDNGTVADPSTASGTRSKAQIFLHMGA